MFGPVVAFGVPGAPLLMILWRHTRLQALIIGHRYWRCIATVGSGNILYK